MAVIKNALSNGFKTYYNNTQCELRDLLNKINLFIAMGCKSKVFYNLAAQ